MAAQADEHFEHVLKLSLAAHLPHVHTQLLRLLTSQWQLLHALPAEGAAGEVSGILAARGVDGGSMLLSTLEVGASAGGGKAAATTPGGGGGGGEGVLSLLQYAAREANEKGAVAPGEERASEKAYEKLGRLVPGLMGGRGRIEA